jgi:hypothetical protein
MKRAAAVAAALLGLVAVIVLVALAALWASGSLAVTVPGHAVPAATACEEDMPCWDCATMGNRQCSTPQPTEVTRFVGQHADAVSADLRRHGFTAVTYRTTGTDVPFAANCTPFTVVDEVYTQLSTASAVLTTHITDTDALAQWLKAQDPQAWIARCSVPASV